MKLFVTGIAIIGLAGCLPEGTAPKPKPAAADWATATPPAGPPATRFEAIEIGFPHELPEAPQVQDELPRARRHWNTV